MKSSFKISDKNVSTHESFDILSTYLLIARGFESPDYEASEIGLCLFLSLTFFALTSYVQFISISQLFCFCDLPIYSLFKPLTELFGL